MDKETKTSMRCRNLLLQKLPLSQVLWYTVSQFISQTFLQKYSLRIYQHGFSPFFSKKGGKTMFFPFFPRFFPPFYLKGGKRVKNLISVYSNQKNYNIIGQGNVTIAYFEFSFSSLFCDASFEHTLCQGNTNEPCFGLNSQL